MAWVALMFEFIPKLDFWVVCKFLKESVEVLLQHTKTKHQIKLCGTNLVELKEELLMEGRIAMVYVIYFHKVETECFKLESIL